MRAAAPLSALFARGAAGLPPAAPVEFATLALPRSPNACLAAPPGFPGAHLATPPLPVDAATAWPVLRRLPERFPRTHLLAAWPERWQTQWVVRSVLLNFPDLVVAELVSGPAGAGLFLYSRSLFGWSDFGVNRRRVIAWLAALDEALRRG
ncbi:DUF1499 domain-containing protein [Crenalkalicoccus roseus]|uniref:DUF1499 domain-containing protein n=1 Tax=Crenalkalicoccus roseus TaxID=1485588 RepID=UPI00108218AB|nr:DUF1499 domain-containing protein [Crenalkalicoccus roseus]